MTSEVQPTVIIIGAGLAGLAMSLGLSKTGKYNIHLVEKKKSFALQGATLGLGPNGRKALEEICPEVAQDIREAGVEVKLMEPWTNLLLQWWKIRDALLKRVQERNDVITVHMGLDIDSIDDDETTPFASVRFKNSPLVLEGQLVIGADGVNSAVRGILGHASALPTNAYGWRGGLDVSKPNSKLAYLRDKGYVPFSARVKDLVILVFSHYPRSSRLTWALTSTLEHAADVKDTAGAFHLFKEDVDEETWATLTHLLGETEPETMMSFRVKVHDMSEEALQLVGDGWGGRGRVTLIGDAAHAMRATMGQGGSMAFEDCAVLSRILSRDDISDYLSSRSLCETNIVLPFEQERLSRVRVIHEDTRLQTIKAYSGEKFDPNRWDPDFASWVYSGV